MVDPSTQTQLKAAIQSCIASDRALLDELRAEIRPLKAAARKIQARSTTSISLVATDGGNNQLTFDPFMVQIVRVVDSSNNEYYLDAISPTTPINEIDSRQFAPDGTPITALGEMMQFLGVASLTQLSSMIRSTTAGAPVSPTWVQVYRSLVEWSIIFSLLNRSFGTDVLIVVDGLLRSKVFAGDLFARLIKGMESRISDQLIRTKRHIYLVGLAKHSKVLTRYHLAMALEGVLVTDYAAYVEVPREVEEKAYIWSEFARGEDNASQSGEVNKFVGGKMFLVKFGNGKRDPVWPVDILLSQANQAAVVLGSMLSDAVEGFPVPHYPRCLQKAHENAALVDFDFDILQDYIYEGVRSVLGSQGQTLDTFQLQDHDPSSKRYG